MSRDSRNRHRTTLGLAAALSCAMAAGCATTHQQRQDKAEQHWGAVRAKIKLQLAEQHIERGRVDDAVAFVDEALNWDPDSAAGYALLAKCHLAQGKLGAAARAIERAVALGEPGAALASLRGLVAERQGDYESALLYYRQARMLDDSQVDYLISEAECLVSMGQSVEAAELLEYHLRDYDHDPNLSALIGEIALRAGDDEKAARCFRAVLAAGMFDPVVAEEYALLAVRFGDYADALAVLEPLIAERPDEAPNSVRLAAAESMLAMNRTEAAKLTLTELLKRHPRELGGWVLLAKAGVMTDDLPTMRRGASKARQLAPSDPQVLLLDAFVSIRENRLDRAEDTLLRLVAANDEDVLAHCMLGMTAERSHDAVSARRHYRRALALDPHCTWARTALDTLGQARQSSAAEVGLSARRLAKVDAP